jgi:hypothetical protein
MSTRVGKRKLIHLRAVFKSGASLENHSKPHHCYFNRFLFIIIFIFKYFIEKNAVNIRVYLLLLIIFSLISPLTMPFVMIGITLSYFLSCERRRTVELLVLIFSISVVPFFGLALILYSEFESFYQFYWYLREIFIIYVSFGESNPILDFMSFKSPHTLDLSILLNKLLLIGTLFVVLISICFKSFFKTFFSRFLIYLSLYMIFVTYTGIFEFTAVSGRSQWYLIFTLILLLASFFNHITIKMNTSSDYLIKIYIAIFLINLTCQIFIPIKLS